MRRLSYGLAGPALLLVVLPVSAMMIAPASIPQRVAQADVVAVGKVTAIEEKTVTAPSFPGVKDKVEYTIAVIKVKDAFLGGKGLTHIKVGYVVAKETPGGPGGGPIIRPGIRRPQIKFEMDQEVCVFLKKHHEGDFYVAQAYFDVIDKKQAGDTFDKQVEEAKKAAKVLADPKASLKSKDAETRMTTAAMLVSRYRGGIHGPDAKQEEIDADESKLILKALAEADWNPKPRPGVVGFNTLNPLAAFGQLGLTDKDGFAFKFAPGQPPTAYQDAAKAWLKDHADTYRIKRFVTEKKDEKKDK
jgi:hypothetical protein